MILRSTEAWQRFLPGTNSGFAMITLPPALQKNAVPARYRGVWQRTLLQNAALSDTTSTVFWLQGARWHADLRIPAAQPDFGGVMSLAECSAAQCDWLARQQGFAGITQVTAGLQEEICVWHRLLDFQPPARLPDAGVMRFEPTRLVESGVREAYLEHWRRLPGSAHGCAVLECVRESGTVPPAPRLLLVAGAHVMHVRARALPWPDGTMPGSSLSDLVAAGRRDLLDFELSFGRRTADGWYVTHASLPWLAQRAVALRLTKTAPRQVRLSWNGVSSDWRIREWSLPAVAASPAVR